MGFILSKFSTQPLTFLTYNNPEGNSVHRLSYQALYLGIGLSGRKKLLYVRKYFLGTCKPLCQLKCCISTPSKPAIFQEQNAGLKPRVREKSLIIGADIMGRDMDQNHGKHAKGHLLHLRIFIKAPQAAVQRPKVLETRPVCCVLYWVES